MHAEKLHVPRGMSYAEFLYWCDFEGSDPVM